MKAIIEIFKCAYHNYKTGEWKGCALCRLIDKDER